MSYDLFKDVYWAKFSCSTYSNFTQITDTGFRFSCPLCGDSKKDKSKARGNIYKSSKGKLKYKCFNCGEIMHFSEFLKRTDQTTYKSYILDIYKDKKPKVRKAAPKPVQSIPKVYTGKALPKAITNEQAKKYLIQRQIPEKHWGKFYYSDNFLKYIVDTFNYDVKFVPEVDPRIVLVCDYKKDLVGLVGRSLDSGNKLRYVNAKIDKSYDILPFGYNKLNLSKTVYGIEGAIDSLFVDNAMSINSSALTTLSKIVDKENLVLIWDNEPRNVDICKLIKSAVDQNYSVVIWPDNIKQKDLNEMILESDITIDSLKEIIKSRTFKGLHAKIQFNRWVKCRLT